MLDIPGVWKLEATILDVSNPTVIVRAEDIGLSGTDLPDDINNNQEACELLEKIRGTAACIMGFAKDLPDATANSPAVPKVGFFSTPRTYTDISDGHVDAAEMDLCVRVISVFKCHKACPLTSSSSFPVAALLEGSVVHKAIGWSAQGGTRVRIGHPSGVMTMYPQVEIKGESIEVPGVAVQRTARRIMDGTLYIRN